MESQDTTILEITEEQDEIHQQPPLTSCPEQQVDITEEQEEIHQQPPIMSPQEQQFQDVITDIEAVIRRNEKKAFLIPKYCICKVPHAMRDQHASAYAPKSISIGPFHYGDERLQGMEMHKEIFCTRFFHRSNKRYKIRLSDLVGYVTSKVQEVRDSYSEDISLSDKELVKLILRDAGFIMELFFVSHITKKEKLRDANVSGLWVGAKIDQDLLLLENQLPFFLIEDLFEKAHPHHIPPFRELTYLYFNYYNMQNLNPDPEVKIEHFTDLLRIFHLPPKRISDSRKLFHATSDILIYSAQELQDAGIKLKAGTSKCILDLKLPRNNVLEVPEITVDVGTEVLFRNMIAFEHFRHHNRTYITDYVGVLDCLINTDRDVDVLIHQKIIRNHLGDSKSVARLFNSLWKNNVPVSFSSQYLDLCESLNEFYRDPCRKRKAALRRDYCRTPWQTVASIAAFMLLIFALIQTIFSILQVALK